MSAAPSAAARAAFVDTHTQVAAAPLCPEIALYSTDAFTTLWQLNESELKALGIETPFWAIPWAGGQALARYLLDHPVNARDAFVLDVGCGGGIVAIAAARAGAYRVLANDPDPLALVATSMNAVRNSVAIETLEGDLLHAHAPKDVNLIVAADLWFNEELATRATGWLRAQVERGLTVLIADPWRPYLPRTGIRLLAEYDVPTSTDIERHALTRAGVWQLLA